MSRAALTSLLIVAACSSDGTGPSGAGPAAKLAFVVQPPEQWSADRTISPAPQVAIQDSEGNTLLGATNMITLALGTNPGGSTLTGTVSVAAVNGVASFPLLHIDRSGTGVTLEASSAKLTSATSAPFKIRLDLGAVSAGDSFTCGVTLVGYAYCWGTNGGGMLGTGTTTGLQQCGLLGVVDCSTTPVAVAGAIQYPSPQTLIPAVSTGANHACGVNVLGAAYCWGTGNVGQLGNGDTTPRAQPVPVSGAVTFATLSSGRDFTCAVTSGGAAYCWGVNSYGQLGTGTTTGPQQCGNTIPCSTMPVAVAGGLSFAAVSAGGFHACGLTAAGAAYCWGANGNGALGNGTTTSSATPVPVSGGLTFSAVSAGRDFTCALTTGGAAYCWGTNDNGQLGDGTLTGRSSPAPVNGGITFNSVSAGDSHVCGVDPNGHAYCWGDNSSGELGDGTLTSRTSPTLVALAYVGVPGVVTVSAGSAHTCALSFQPVVFCWGHNFWGELGDASTTPSMVPVLVVQ